MSEFVDYLSEVFESFGPIRVKRMFGGYGLYHNDVMFALVAKDELFLKADAETEKHFQQLGLKPFDYVRQNKTLAMSYYAAPEVIFDDPDEARTWAKRAYEAAVRSTGKKSRKRSSD